MAKHLILLVDDDVPILRLVRAKLQADGYSVMTAGSGQEALAALGQERPDLVVLDLRCRAWMDSRRCDAFARTRMSRSSC